jgi:hypothetical protein
MSHLRVLALACLLAVAAHPGPALADVPSPSVVLTGTYYEAHVDTLGGNAEGHSHVHGETHAHEHAAHDEAFQLVTSHGAYDLAGPADADSGERVTLTALESPDGLVVRDTAPAPARATAAAAVAASGAKTILVMPVRWGAASQPVTPAAAETLLNGDAAAWYSETSYGALSISATSTPVLTIPDPGACNASAVQTNAINAAQAAGYTPSSYTNRMIIVPNQYCTWGGLGQVGGPTSWIRGDQWSLRIPVHELGHNLGLWHSNALLCTDSQTLACTEHEYYHPYDAMGLAWEGVGHFGAPQKAALGWIAERSRDVTASGPVTLDPIESAAMGTQAVRIATAHRTYWLEYRVPQLFDLFASHPPNGVYVTIEKVAGLSTTEGPMLLDMHPGTSVTSGFGDAEYDRMLDAALTAGESYADPWNELSITVEATGASAQLMLTLDGPDTTPPSAPALASPAPNQAVQSSTPKLSWATATDAGGSGLAGYDVTLDGVVIASPSAAATSQTISAPLAEGAHTWSVTARDGAGHTTPSATRTFWVDHTAPAPFSVTRPAAGATVRVRRPVISWTGAADAHSGVQAYRLIVDGHVDHVFGPAARSGRIAASLKNGAHTLRVVAVDRAGNARPTAVVRFAVRV